MIRNYWALCFMSFSWVSGYLETGFPFNWEVFINFVVQLDDEGLPPTFSMLQNLMYRLWYTDAMFSV